MLLNCVLSVDVEAVRTIMPAGRDENTRFAAADEYVRTLGFALHRITCRFMVKGGVELALLRTSGLYVVQLRIATGKEDREPDLHCVAYDGITVRDNYKWAKVKQLDEGDHSSPEAARKVFGSLFSAGLEVRIKNVYELVRL